MSDGPPKLRQSQAVAHVSRLHEVYEGPRTRRCFYKAQREQAGRTSGKKNTKIRRQEKVEFRGTANSSTEVFRSKRHCNHPWMRRRNCSQSLHGARRLDLGKKPDVSVRKISVSFKV
ncbi:hypothetical protein AU467_31330 [Mesorhizobium loti]|uniref:Uncharacterized protein n=1 Tax=Rhizobium loti TaxID=381 RepID=A0A117N208_RHILI|nr:hypothetical protein AU467_31330 [Mesorhizobium loti]